MKNTTTEQLLTLLKTAYCNTDAVQTVTLFYELAQRYQQEGKEEKALVYLNRFDELVGCDDDLYEQFEEQDKQASEWIALMKEKPSYAKEIRDWVQEKETKLNKLQKMQWNLLTLARMNQLFAKFSELSGFEVFDEYEEILDILTGSIYFGSDLEEEQRLDDFLLDLEDTIEMEHMISDKSKIEMEDGADFEALDLLGDGMYTNMMLALYGIVDTLEGEVDKEISLDFVTNAMHISYYARTCEQPMNEIPALAKELERIKEDYEYVTTSPNDDDFTRRMSLYKKLILP